MAVGLTILTFSTMVLGIRERDYGSLPLSVIAAVVLITAMIPTLYVLALPGIIVLLPFAGRPGKEQAVIVLCIAVVLCGAAFLYGLHGTGVNDRLLYPMV
jgi:hypothetical protein